MKESHLPLPFPLKGLVVNTAYAQQPPGTTASCLNVRGYDPKAGRDRGARRSGLTKYMAVTVAGAYPVQCVDHVVTSYPLPVPAVGDFITPDPFTTNDSALWTSGAVLAGQMGTVSGTYQNSCWDTTSNGYVAITTAGTLQVRRVDVTGATVWNVTLLGSGGWAVPGMCVDPLTKRLFLAVAKGGGAPAWRLFALKTLDGTNAYSGTNAYFASNTTVPPGVVAGNYANLLAYCNGVLATPAVGNGGNLDLYYTSTLGALITVGPGGGGPINDVGTDGVGFFYWLGQGGLRLSKAPWNGSTLNWSAVVTGGTTFTYDTFKQRLMVCTSGNSLTQYTPSGVKGATTALAGPGTWKLVRQSGLGGFDLFAQATTNHFQQLDGSLNVVVAFQSLALAGAFTPYNGNGDCPVNLGALPVSSSVALIGPRLIAVANGTAVRCGRTGTTALGGGQGLSPTAPVIFSAAMGGKLFFADGSTFRYYDSATDAVLALSATAGNLPTDTNGNAPRLVAVWRNRLVYSGLPLDGSNWFMSKVGDPANWNYNPVPTSETQAVAGNAHTAGIVPDVINCLCPYSDEIILLGGDHSLFQMTGDPMAGGRIDLVADVVGMAFGQPYCRDGTGRLFFVSPRGSVYRFVPGGIPERISDPVFELLVGIDFTASVVRLAWDERQFGFHVFVTTTAPTTALRHFFYDVRSEAWWIDAYAALAHNPTTCHVLQGFTAADGVVLLGCQDGYLRQIDTAAADDDGTAIESYTWIGPIKDKEGSGQTVVDLQGTLDMASSDVTWGVYAGSHAQEALGSAARDSGTFKAGRNRSAALRVFGHALYVKLSAKGNVWGLESLAVRVRLPQGKGRQRVF